MIIKSIAELKKLKKILILIDWFYPGYKAGGPIQSCVNICKVLQSKYEIFVLTTDTDHGEVEPYAGISADNWHYNEAMGVQIYYASKSKICIKQLADQINHVAADFIYLNHLFSPYFVVYPLWLKFRQRINAQVVVCPRGALYDSALSLKSYKKKPLLTLYKWLGIEKKVLFHATNDRESAAVQQYFKGAKIKIADNLPDANQLPFANCNKQPGTLKCIFIARIVPIKNLLFLLELLLKSKGQIELTIAGPIENEAYWGDCNKVIVQMPGNVKVTYVGAVKKEAVDGLIKQHHLFILPTTGENFGHSILEAFSAGRPVLISDQTPWLDLAHQNAGWDIPLQQPQHFIEVIEQLTNYTQQQFDLLAGGAWKYAANFINNNAAKKQYFQLFI